MIPAIVKFTGLQIDPWQLLKGRYVTGIISSNWCRIRFEIDQEGNLDKINRWVSANINGRFASYIIQIRFGLRIVVIAFEDDPDAVMFRLKGGETAWRMEQSDG